MACLYQVDEQLAPATVRAAKQGAVSDPRAKMPFPPSRARSHLTKVNHFFRVCA